MSWLDSVTEKRDRQVHGRGDNKSGSGTRSEIGAGAHKSDCRSKERMKGSVQGDAGDSGPASVRGNKEQRYNPQKAWQQAKKRAEKERKDSEGQ